MKNKPHPQDAVRGNAGRDRSGRRSHQPATSQQARQVAVDNAQRLRQQLMDTCDPRLPRMWGVHLGMKLHVIYRRPEIVKALGAATYLHAEAILAQAVEELEQMQAALLDADGVRAYLVALFERVAPAVDPVRIWLDANPQAEHLREG